MQDIESKYLHFGLDFLGLNFPDRFKSTLFESFFIGLSVNSNFFRLEWYGYKFDVTFTGAGDKNTLMFSYGGFPVINLAKMKNMGACAPVSYKMCFYGMFFAVDKDFSQDFLNKFFDKYENDCDVSRVDIALDVPVSVSKFLKKGYKTNYNKISEFGKNERTGDIETKQFGTKGTKKHMIRVYDKLKDSKKKEKMAIYLDYFSHPNVTRVECEINLESCKRFCVTMERVRDPKFQQALFRSICMNPRGTEFNYLSCVNFDVNVIPYRKRISSEKFDELDYIRRFIGYAKGVFDMGLDPADILRDNKDYQNYCDQRWLQKACIEIEKIKNIY